MRLAKINKLNPRIKHLIVYVFIAIAACCSGIGLFYFIDISNYKYPNSRIIGGKSYINFDPDSRYYCDTYHISINFGWSARDLPEKGNEIRFFHDEKLSQKFFDSRYLDGQSAYLIFSYWMPLPRYKHFFIDAYKVYSGAWTDKYGLLSYVYAIDTRFYIGIFPKIDNTCPNQ